MSDSATTISTYTRGQKIFHWLLAFLLLFWLFVSGNFVEQAEGTAKGVILMFHSGGAIVIGVLMLFRYRLRRKNPVQPLQDLKSWEQTWSKRVHMTLYLLVAFMVSSGLLQAMFFDQEVRVAGFLNVTLGYNENLMQLFHLFHASVATAFKILIALHVMAALKHQFLDNKRVLKRMA